MFFVDVVRARCAAYAWVTTAKFQMFVTGIHARAFSRATEQDSLQLVPSPVGFGRGWRAVLL